MSMVKEAASKIQGELFTIVTGDDQLSLQLPFGNREL
jgi:hypothetical protein